jgi:hypothetical protein
LKEKCGDEMKSGKNSGNVAKLDELPQTTRPTKMVQNMDQNPIE